MAIPGNLLGIGLSGLSTYQKALSSTSDNISNANTEGYHRKRVDITTGNTLLAKNGSVGTGARVQLDHRMYDSFLEDQIRSGTSQTNALSTYGSLASQVDNLIGDSASGLSSAMQTFFNAVQDVAADPSSSSVRQTLLSDADSLVGQFHTIDNQLANLQEGINSQLAVATTEINALAFSLANINQAIMAAPGRNNGNPPNALMDQRDFMLAKLSEQVSLTTVSRSNGSLDIFIGNGQSLVSGNKANSLTTTASVYDASRKEVALVQGNSTIVISDRLRGGGIGGLLDVRKEVFDVTQNGIGRVATGLKKTFNDQHKLGLDLNGSIGSDFFGSAGVSVQSRPATTNQGTGVIGVSITNPNNLSTSNYKLDFDGTNHTLIRLTDNVIVSTTANFPSEISSEGITLSLTSGSLVSGDSFLILPTSREAKDITLLVSDTAKIASSSSISTEATLGNAGTGEISSAVATNTTGVPLVNPITLTFVAATNTFTITNGPGGSLSYNPTTESAGKTFSTEFSSFGGLSFTISGTPQDGDTLILANNTGAVGDNANMLILSELQTKQTLLGGTADYSGAFRQVVSNVGTKTQQAQINGEAQGNLLNHIVSARDSVSGVNLDEEAANLIRFEQAYQATAQVISIANSLFDTLLNAVGR